MCDSLARGVASLLPVCHSPRQIRLLLPAAPLLQRQDGRPRACPFLTAADTHLFVRIQLESKGIAGRTPLDEPDHEPPSTLIRRFGNACLCACVCVFGVLTLNAWWIKRGDLFTLAHSPGREPWVEDERDF